MSVLALELRATQEPASIDPLVRVLVAYFDDTSLSKLCGKLGLEYEHLSGETTEDQVTDLVSRMVQEDRFGELVHAARELKGYIGLNLQGVLSGIIPRTSSLWNVLDGLFSQLHEYSRKLYEWKEVHNRLDASLTNFGQFAVQVDRFVKRRETLSVDELDVLAQMWRPVHREVDGLTLWASSDMQLIGDQFTVLDDGSIVGEKWAVQVYRACAVLDDHLASGREVRVEQGIPQARLQRTWNWLSRNTETTVWWYRWSHRLLERTREMDDVLKRHMSQTDKELRKAAEDLRNLSRQAFWS